MKIAACVDTGLASQDMSVKHIRKAILEPATELQTVIEPSSIAALQLAVSLSAEEDSVTAVSYGSETNLTALEYALAFGVNSVVHLADEENGGAGSANSPAIARALAEWLEDESFDLIVCGNPSGTGLVPSLIAGYLGIPCLPRVYQANVSESGTVDLYQRLERGWRQRVTARLPAVVTVQAGFFPCRYVSVRRRRQASKEIDTTVQVVYSGQNGEDGVDLRSVTAPKPRAKRTAVPDSKQSAADRLKALVGGGIGTASKPNSSKQQEEKKRVIEAEPDQAAKEIIDFLEEKELLPDK